MGRNLLLILILATAAGVALWVRGQAPSEIDPNQPIEGQESPSVEPRKEPLGLSETSVNQEQRESQAPTEAANEKGAEGTLRLRIIAKEGQTPISGVRAYLGEEALSGPSDQDGWLEFTPPVGRRTTFWAPGWSPAEFLSRDMSEEFVELSRATASLEVFVDNLAPAEGVLLNRLEPMGWTATDNSAWSAPLQKLAPHHLFGDKLPAGRYQLYVWIGAFQDQGIALEPIEVELEQGKKTVVRRDASVRPDDEVDS